MESLNTHALRRINSEQTKCIIWVVKITQTGNKKKEKGTKKPHSVKNNNVRVVD